MVSNHYLVGSIEVVGAVEGAGIICNHCKVARPHSYDEEVHDSGRLGTASASEKGIRSITVDDEEG